MRKSCSDSEKLFLTNYEDTIYLELTQECLQEIEDKISPAENLVLRTDKAKVLHSPLVSCQEVRTFVVNIFFH
jgi:hypothetical protein